MSQVYSFGILPTLFVWISWALPATLYAQAPVDPKAELAARRIEYARQQVERIKAQVDSGAEARIRLDAAERNLEDIKDQIILEGAISSPSSDAAGPSDEDAVAAAERRLDREKTWIARMRELNENGIAPPLDLISPEAELLRRESDLASARDRVFSKAEAISWAATHSNEGQTTEDFNIGEMEHFEGDGIFDKTRDLVVIVKAFQAQFDRPLPISADGATEFHRALGFDHRGRVDVAINPRAKDGIWLRKYLRSRNIPYYAFTVAIAGKSSAAHIHIGPGSSRL